MPGRRASPRRAQQVGCLGLWPGEHHERRVRPLSIDRGKGSLGWTEPIVLLSRGRPLNSRHLRRVRAPRHQPKPRSGPDDLSNDPTDHAVRQLALTLPSVPQTKPPPAWFGLSIGPTDDAVRQLGLTLPSIQRTKALGFPPPSSARKRLPPSVPLVGDGQ